MFNLIAAQCAKWLEKTCSEICLIKAFFKESSAEECSIPIHVPQYVIHVENLPWAYRIVDICVHKTYCKFGARINCNIRTSYSSQFSLISILLNINKASNHCYCWRTITNAYGQCIEADRGLLQGSRNLIMFFLRRMRLLFIGYCVWSFSHYPIADDHVVYIREVYLDCSLPSQNTWSVWNASTKMSQASILLWLKLSGERGAKSQVFRCYWRPLCHQIAEMLGF